MTSSTTSTTVIQTGAMSDSIRIAGISVAILLMVFCVLMVGTLSYDWSYTVTSFGGHLGFLLPIVLCLLCFVAGIMTYHFARAD